MVGGKHEPQSERRDKVIIPRCEMTQSSNAFSGVASGVGITRADAVKDWNSSKNILPKTSAPLQTPNFEQQIREIDDAINGDAPTLISEPCKDVIVTEKEYTQAHKDSTLVKKEWAIASGLEKESQHQAPLTGPKDSHLMHGTTTGAVLGLHNCPKFIIGPASPKEIRIKTLKKPKGGDQKKNKENRGPLGKEKTTSQTRTCMQGVDKSGDSNMEVEVVGMGEKRKARIPLIELENMEGNGKRIKMEREVKELGKILAKHLGSAEARCQPRRAQ